MILKTVFIGCYIIGAITLLFFKGKTLWKAVQGDDNQLQSVELVTLIWLILYPFCVLGSVFLEIDVDSEIWDSLNFIMAGSVLGKVSKEGFKKIKNEKSDSISS